MHWPLMTVVLLAFALIASTALASESAQAARQESKKPHVVFVTGDHEYESEVTMPMIARILEERHGMKCTVLYAVDETGERNPHYEKNIPGLEALATADLMVMYVRFRVLPDDQLRMILDYVKDGRPVIGLRTSTHAFLYREGPHVRWNDDFGRDVFGQKWIRHHGGNSTTRVDVMLADHPITRGIDPTFHGRSWLYHVIPLHGDCVPLLNGTAVQGLEADGPIFGTPSPVAWTKTYRGGRVFFTTLGHIEEFAETPMRRLLVNGIYWALGKEADIPAGGCNVEPVEP